MISAKLTAKILHELKYSPTPGQQLAVEEVVRYLSGPGSGIFLLTGYAGTGKTSLIASLVRSLEGYRYRTVLMAPTGRAAKVFSAFAGKPAYTIHKLIYRQKRSVGGFGEFELDRNLARSTLFLVDEASMISDHSLDLSPFGSGRLLEDLIKYVFSGPSCKLVLIGDEAQLPPVGFDRSPALDPSMLSAFGFPVSHCSLTEVVRQEAGSMILSNATLVRSKLNEGSFGFPGLTAANGTAVESIGGDALIEALQRSYDTAGLDETLVVCRSNKQANRYNEGVRNMILWKDNEIGQGDLVMVVRNNYFWLKDSPEVDFIANGDILEVMRVRQYRELYNFRFCEMTLRFTDYRQFEFDALVLLDALRSESASLDRDGMRNLFAEVSADYQHMKGKKHRSDAIQQDPYFNALQIKFAYAMTCHKAQGGQWKHVYIDQVWVDEAKLDKEYYRWLYTAVTRATEKVFLVNFRPEFLNPQ